jgi:hypothetical protein
MYGNEKGRKSDVDESSRRFGKVGDILDNGCQNVTYPYQVAISPKTSLIYVIFYSFLLIVHFLGLA